MDPDYRRLSGDFRARFADSKKRKRSCGCEFWPRFLRLGRYYRAAQFEAGGPRQEQRTVSCAQDADVYRIDARGFAWQRLSRLGVFCGSKSAIWRDVHLLRKEQAAD